MSATKITKVTFEEFSDIEFMPPSTFYIKDAMGDYIYIHLRSRAKAQEWIDETYGKGKYRVMASKTV